MLLLESGPASEVPSQAVAIMIMIMMSLPSHGDSDCRVTGGMVTVSESVSVPRPGPAAQGSSPSLVSKSDSE
jgi:hypothetical protein